MTLHESTLKCPSNELNRTISYVCENEYGYFLSKQNVQGVACGYKVKNGFKTNQLCIQIFVNKKLSKHNLFFEDIVPLYFKGISTDVIETGEFKSCSLKKRIRPVLGGYSISSTLNEEYFGTTGCLITNGILNFVLGTVTGIDETSRTPFASGKNIYSN